MSNSLCAMHGNTCFTCIVAGVIAERFNNKYGHPLIRTNTCHRKQEKLYQNVHKLSKGPAHSHPVSGRYCCAYCIIGEESGDTTCPGSQLQLTPEPGLITWAHKCFSEHLWQESVGLTHLEILELLSHLLSWFLLPSGWKLKWKRAGKAEVMDRKQGERGWGRQLPGPSRCREAMTPAMLLSLPLPAPCTVTQLYAGPAGAHASPLLSFS